MNIFMRMTWIGFLLILSIVLQSFVAVADTKDTHQLDSEHLKTEHSHALDQAAFNTDFLDTEHDVKDCHHCGHCQGSHAQWLASLKNAETPLKLIALNQYIYLNHLDKSYVEELNRPPIS